jgi:GrpB-like predicted nucleotidyltransferase (UPF0157 family)
MSEVVLVEHQAAWSAHFEAAAAELRSLFGDAALAHIGSTAVPGLCAKPVIDVMLGVAALGEVEGRIAALAEAGFRYRPEHETVLPERRYFTRQAVPAVHLHVLVRGGQLWRQHLHCRDLLRGQPELREAYAQLKRDLARRHAHDKAAYTEAKAPFIRRLLALPVSAGRN